MFRNQRGSALLTSFIVIMVITVIGVGMIRFASREVVGAYAGAHEQSLVNCAEAARIQLLAYFHAIGFQPSSVTALNVPLGTTTAANAQTVAVGGHYDTPAGEIVIDQVGLLPGSTIGPSNNVGDLTGRSTLMGQGGQPYKVVVHCQDGTSGGRQLEVEFGIQFGL